MGRAMTRHVHRSITRLASTYRIFIRSLSENLFVQGDKTETDFQYLVKRLMKWKMFVGLKKLTN